MSYRRDLWEVASVRNGVMTVAEAEDAGVPAVEVRKLASRGALEACGQGVYKHWGVPNTTFTQPTIAVALAGEGAFLQRESVLDLLGLGQFNPIKIRVGTRRRVRRSLPGWLDLEYRPDITDEDLWFHEGVLMTTVQRALIDMRPRMPRERWSELVRVAERQDLVSGLETLMVEGVVR